MKIDGQTLENEHAIYGPVIIRRGKKLLAFYAQPVWSYDYFHEVCPRPEAPVSAFSKTGKKTHDEKNPVHLENLTRYGLQIWGFMTLTSLQPSNLDLSEHGVSLDDPDTWHKVEAALTYDKDTNPKGLSHYEFKEVMDLVNEANMMDAEKMETNLASFLAERDHSGEPAEPSQSGEAENSDSGKLASDGG